MEEHLEKLRRLREKMPNYREVLELAERILLEKGRAKREGSFPSLTLDPIKARIQRQEGFPQLKPGEIPLDSAWTELYFCRLLEVFKEVNSKKQQDLLRALEARKFVFDQFLRRLLQNQLLEDHLGEEWGPEGSLLFFFLVQSLKPTFEVLAASWRTNRKEFSFAHGFCPFCGGLPGLGEIQEEGKRVLHCLLCSTAWQYPRLRCPYCQNENQEKFTYFQVEGEMGYRVDLCLNCRHYLKTVDTRQREGPMEWEVEDYLTLHLDHLAQTEGYTRPAALFGEIV